MTSYRDWAFLHNSRVLSRVQWVLVLALIVAAGSILVLLTGYSQAGAELQEETAEMVGITEMESALATVQADVHSVLDAADSDAEGEAQSVAGLAGPLATLEGMVEGVWAATGEDEEFAPTRDAFVAYRNAIEEMMGDADLGSAAVSAHRSDVQRTEGALIEQLLAFHVDEVKHLNEATHSFTSLRVRLEGLVPVLIISAALLGLTLVWIQRLRRIKDRQSFEAESRRKDEFIAGISHEIRTPLTAVLGFLEIIHASPDMPSDERRELVEIASEEAADLAHLVEDLLVLAKGRAGTLAVVRRSVAVSAQVAHVLGSIAGADEFPVTGDLTVMGDPVRIRQVFRNLVTNAIRYGGDEVSIELCRDGETGCIRVIDNGKGVPAEDAERIFLAYERAHTVRGVPSSVGLGLAVSRQLARAMGGELDYRRVDDNTIFELRLDADLAQRLHPSAAAA